MKVFDNNKNIYYLEISIDDCFIYPLSDVNNLTDNQDTQNNNLLNKLFGYFFFSLLRINLSFFLNHKYNSNESILIITNNKFEAITFAKIIQNLGYTFITICHSNLNLNDLVIDTDNTENKEFKIINLDDSNARLKMEFYDIIFDLSDRFNKNKLEYIEMCGYNSNLIFIDNFDKLTQLDPQDIEILFEKNMSIKFSSSKNYFRHSKNTGRTLNFLESMREKVVNKFSLSNFIKKVNYKSYELIEILNTKKEIANLVTDTSNQNNNLYNIIEFNF